MRAKSDTVINSLSANHACLKTLRTAEIFVGLVGAVELAVALELNVDTGAVMALELSRTTRPHRPVAVL